MLDPEGVIRYKDVRGAAMEDAVDALMKKLPKADAKTAIAVHKPQDPSWPAKPAPSDQGTEKPAGKAGASPAAGSTGAASEFRVWTRRDGMVATMRLVSVEGKGARLATASGKQYVIPLERLSDADQQWIRDHWK